MKTENTINEARNEVLIMATNNEHKLREIRQILGDEYTVKGLADIGCHEDIPETADTLEGNALQKARYVHEHYGLDCFADDTGLEVDALGGAPGVYTARFGSMNGYGDHHDFNANIDCLLDKMQGKSDRRARFRTAIALIKNGEEHLFSGEVEGNILSERTGENGFGYDPVFAPIETGLSFAQMGEEGKNAISHRARATQQLVQFLRSTLALLVGLLMPLLANANLVGEWQYYRSYQYATQCVLAGNMVYASYAGNLLSYNTEDSEVRTYNALTVLNGITIKHMAYCPQAKRLVLVYDDCGIDLVDADGNVSYVADLKDKNIANKNVNGITIDGKMAYLATGFGFVELDIEEGVFRNKYMLKEADNTPISINCAIRMGNTFYLSHDGGLLQGNTEDNLFLSENWKKFGSGKCGMLYPMQGGFIGLQSGKIFTYREGEGKRDFVTSVTTFFTPTSQGFMWGVDEGNEKRVYQCDAAATTKTEIQREDKEYTWISAAQKGNDFWVCEGYGGLSAYRLADGKLLRTISPILLNSPIRDLSYQLTWVGDRLLVAGGVNTNEAFYNPPTSMYFEHNQWTNFEEMPLPQDRPQMKLANTTNLVQDPDDPNHHFASLHRNGLFEYRNGKFVKYYDPTNSTLRSILPTSARWFNYVACSGARYDREGNLWMLASETADLLHVMQKDGTWHALHYDEVDHAMLCDNILLHSSGKIFFNVQMSSPRGIMGIDPGDTLISVNDDRHFIRMTITNQDGTRYDPDFFYDMCEDKEGRIWCGTSSGLFIIEDTEKFFEDDFHFLQMKVSRNDGSGLADYLLNGQAVKCIAVDGAGRKWVGTQNAGVYLISEDGQEMVHHFTSEDSPLLSDCIYSIAVHPVTGLVMFATSKGLCSFGSDASESYDELDADNIIAYPNPVTPDYTGPIVIRGFVDESEVKILSASGQLIWRGTSNGGMITWNGCNARGQRVASGIYHIVANDKDGDKAVVSRIAIIR